MNAQSSQNIRSPQSTTLLRPEDPIADLNGIRIELWIRDSDVASALEAYPEGRARDEFTRTAIRIGVLALQHAQGRIDAEAIRTEGQRLIGQLEAQLASYQTQVSSTLSNTLRDYFDPANGRFPERVDRLLRKDGDLERAIRGEMDASLRRLNESLETRIGPGSTFAQLLTPEESNVLLGAIRRTVDGIVTTQHDALLREFTLNNPDGALRRLLDELKTKNDCLAQDLKGSVQAVVAEFSLDSEQSALSRLVRRVETAQRQISAEFTLDAEQSALSRMKRDLQSALETMRKDSVNFQQTVIAALAAAKARKEETMASTRHGTDFELAAFEFIEDQCQKAGDVPEHTGNKTGDIKHCKIGDCVITLGPDCEAAGAKVVCEMKENASYDLQRSLNELTTARANRRATIGLFVHSKRSAPTGLKPLARYGSDVVVVWDSEDDVTDTYLMAALMVCKALAIAKAEVDSEFAADLATIDKAIREIERLAAYLDEIKTSSTTIKNGADKILSRVETMRVALAGQVQILNAQIIALRGVLDTTPHPS